MQEQHVAVDVGGTTIDVAVHDSPTNLKPIVRDGFATQQVNKDASPSDREEAFWLDWNRLIKCINDNVVGSPTTISVGAAGSVSESGTHLEGAGNIVHWEHRPIVWMLQKKYNCPVVLGNDGVGMALLEAYYGKGQGHDFLLCIWGTGNNLSVVRWHDGVPFAYAAEGGHQLVERNNGLLRFLPYWRFRRYKCGCGRFNCLEAVCGGGNLARRHGSAQRISRRQWRRYARVMALGIYNAAVLNPVPLVVFTGGVISKQPWLLPIIEEELLKLKIIDPPELMLSQFSEQGTLGALALGRRMHNDNSVPVK